MRKLIPFFLLSILFYDVTLDALEAQCKDRDAVSCHACVCQIHATNPDSSGGVKIPDAEPRYVPLKDPQLSERLSDKSLFHPPKSIS